MSYSNYLDYKAVGEDLVKNAIIANSDSVTLIASRKFDAPHWKRILKQCLSRSYDSGEMFLGDLPQVPLGRPTPLKPVGDHPF